MTCYNAQTRCNGYGTAAWWIEMLAGRCSACGMAPWWIEMLTGQSLAVALYEVD